MKEKDVKIVHMKGSDVGAALIANKVAAAVLWEPWLSQAQRLSGTKVLISSKEEPVIVDVLATTKEIAQKKKSDIKKFVDSWFESLAYADKNKDRAHTLMAIPLGISTKELNYSLKEEKELLKLLNQFKETLVKTSTSYKPHHTANYLISLAQSFNEFYHKCPVISEKTSIMKSRLLLVDCVRQTLKNGLGLLGIKAPEEM